ncbi:hypothetical protein DSO57_1008163 [Entomophthora muscae]|uniref:Uncharacterized protein n=1 Tax=Entomophthora muscae TaxID=34485 RepID=A0ACC2T727_9FUNG|nr:hypothetical protein DSO57_1008163 [Entomophthora muscae]
MHPVIGLLRYILYNLILNQIISGRWGPVAGTLLLVPPNVNFIPANFAAPPILETENCIISQCPEFYAEDALMLSQVIFLGLLWLGLIVLLNTGVTIGNFTKKYLKPRWWLIINSMWIWVLPSPVAVVETGSSASYFCCVMSFWHPDYFPAPPTDEILREVLSALSFYSGSSLSHKSQVYHVMTKVSEDA